MLVSDTCIRHRHLFKTNVSYVKIKIWICLYSFGMCDIWNCSSRIQILNSNNCHLLGYIILDKK